MDERLDTVEKQVANHDRDIREAARAALKSEVRLGGIIVILSLLGQYLLRHLP